MNAILKEAPAGKIEFIDLKAQYRALKADIDARIHKVLDHGQYILGPEVAEMEQKLAAYTGAKHCISCASGTEALLMALLALGIGEGDEVITTPFTFAATAEMIVLAGAKPVYVDIDRDTCLIDATKIEAKITPRTKAIMPVSLYGQVADARLEGAPRLDAGSTLKRGWLQVADDPIPFLLTGMASAAWLDRALPALIAALDALALEGEALLHCDVRSDNVCFVDGRAVLVDWNWACIGNPKVDVGAWLPSLHAEGGPPPETILPDAPEIAAMISGFFACNAGLPPIADAPLVRPLQRRQLSTALPWAVRALGLPPLDGGGGRGR